MRILEGHCVRVRFLREKVCSFTIISHCMCFIVDVIAFVCKPRLSLSGTVDNCSRSSSSSTVARGRFSVRCVTWPTVGSPVPLPPILTVSPVALPPTLSTSSPPSSSHRSQARLSPLVQPLAVVRSPPGSHIRVVFASSVAWSLAGL